MSLKDEHWINGAIIDARGSCGLVVHRIPSNIRALKEGVITAQINARPMHPARRIAIQRERSDAFYNAH